MRSIFTSRKDSATFHLRWRGYDRAEVDDFLRQTAADRRRLQEDLAQLEIVRGNPSDEHKRELERLAALRTEVAGCLEASIGALRTATERLSSVAQNASDLPQTTHLARKPPATTAWLRLKRPVLRLPIHGWISAGGKGLLVVALFAAALSRFVLVDRQEPPAREEPVAHVRTGDNVSPPVPTPEPLVRQIESLLLTITARESCWLRTSIDGGQPLERLLKPNETIMLRAEDEASLRVGNAAALSLLINNQVAKPLGTPGQVVSTRITRSNYLGFLLNN